MNGGPAEGRAASTGGGRRIVGVETKRGHGTEGFVRRKGRVAQAAAGGSLKRQREGRNPLTRSVEIGG
jgi:hypothetical protein